MTVSEAIAKLKEIENDGWGDIALAIYLNGYPSGSIPKFVGIESIDLGDPGGWGNMIAAITTDQEVVKK